MKNNVKNILIHRIKLCLWLMVIGLFLSGITAFPIETELGYLSKTASSSGLMHNWLNKVYLAVKTTNYNYPYLSYGTDWLAFAHLQFAVLFAGAIKDPLKNRWIIEFGIMAAIAIFPLAFVAGSIRGIPVFWRLIDCSFGVATLAILVPCYRMINKLSNLKNIF